MTGKVHQPMDKYINESVVSIATLSLSLYLCRQFTVKTFNKNTGKNLT